MIFISLGDLIFEEFDDSTSFSVSVLNAMDQPEKTIRFDKNTNVSDYINENSTWIQVKDPRI